MSRVTIIGLICNAFSIWVLTDSRLNKSSTFIFLAYLSVCDAITCLVLFGMYFPEMHFSGHQWAEYLFVITWPILTVSSAWSMLLTTALTVDRCVQIKHPHNNGRLDMRSCKINRADVVSFSMLFLALIVNGPRVLVFYVDSETGCRRHVDWADGNNGWYQIHSIIRLIVFRLGMNHKN